MSFPIAWSPPDRLAIDRRPPERAAGPPRLPSHRTPSMTAWRQRSRPLRHEQIATIDEVLLHEGALPDRVRRGAQSQISLRGSIELIRSMRHSATTSLAFCGTMVRSKDASFKFGRLPAGEPQSAGARAVGWPYSITGQGGLPRRHEAMLWNTPSQKIRACISAAAKCPAIATNSNRASAEEAATWNDWAEPLARPRIIASPRPWF
jgi:hypothetical protein